MTVNNDNEILKKREPLAHTRAQRTVQKNKETTFGPEQVRKPRQQWQSQANPRKVHPADTTHITDTHTHTLTHTTQQVN